ncbi:MAG: class I SAM-dependent methyltransferase [Acidobacteria bacterium]|nr:class I SAM-dependent methyltransferase [Acidobacteriota bacterium]
MTSHALHDAPHTASDHASSAHEPHTAHRHAGDHDLPELLNLDARVMAPTNAAIMGYVHAQTSGSTVRRILDVGAGTGTGAIALAQQFPQAEVVALDIAEDMLREVERRAAADGVGARVSVQQVDLNGSWPALGHFELAWACASIHELADPDAAFGKLLALLNPGGMLAITEMSVTTRFFAGTADSEFEERLHTALAPRIVGHNDYPDWTVKLTAAGFTNIVSRTFVADRALGDDAAGGRYAQAYLKKIQPYVAGQLSSADAQRLAALVSDDGEASLRRRTDLSLDALRHTWLGRRP